LHISVSKRVKKRSIVHVLYQGTTVKVADLGFHFKGVFTLSNQISAVSMSKINGRYVFVAAGGGKVAVVSSKDLATFSAPLTIPTPHGVGNSVKPNQPDKNGSTGFSTLHLWFSGGGSAAAGTNRFLRFFHVEVGVTKSEQDASTVDTWQQLPDVAPQDRLGSAQTA
jgi:hypothetical protein